MELQPYIEIFNLGEPNLEAYYTEYPCPAMAIQPHLNYQEREAREIEAHGYCRRPPRTGRKECYEVARLEDVDHPAVDALRCVIDDMQPYWVKEVRDACLLFNHPEDIADECEMSLNVVVAIILNLKTRGEIPDVEFAA